MALPTLFRSGHNLHSVSNDKVQLRRGVAETLRQTRTRRLLVDVQKTTVPRRQLQRLVRTEYQVIHRGMESEETRQYVAHWGQTISHPCLRISVLDNHFQGYHPRRQPLQP